MSGDCLELTERKPTSKKKRCAHELGVICAYCGTSYFEEVEEDKEPLAKPSSGRAKRLFVPGRWYVK